MSLDILCIDVEATCWENNRSKKNEIIEIGITPLTFKDRMVESSTAIIVKPPTTEISPFCTQLTTLTPEFVETYGVSYAEAIRQLNEFTPHKKIFASWGEYDKNIISKNCQWNNVCNPFGNLHLNVKALFAACYGFSCGLGTAATEMNLKFHGTHHRGVDDSRMLALILRELL